MMNVTDYTNIKTLLVKFKEKSDVLYAKAAALSNYATIEWVGTQIPSVGNGTVTIKQNGTSKGSFSMNQSGGATINLTDTTYSSLSAVSGGTDKSLVTTGEKYTWNNKQAAISDLATIRSNAATAYGWGDHSKAGYITGITKAMVESVLTGNITSHTHSYLPLRGGTMANTNVVTNLNADLLDGYHKTDILRETHKPTSVISLNDVVANGIDFTSWDYATSANINNQPDGDGVSSAASVVSFGTDYPFQIYSDYNNTNKLFYRSFYSTTGWKAWRQFAFLDSNVASASKWANARTITLTGSVTGSVSIDGSSNVSLDTTTNHTHTFASLTSKPTTLSGYGITDANNISTVWSAKRLATPYNLICPYTWEKHQSPVTGTLVLSLPYGFNSMMQCIELTVYDYSSTDGSQGATKFFINGYNYSGNNGNWINPYVFRIGNKNVRVRLGYYNDKCCILIGETNTGWNYPRICVDKVYGSFSESAYAYKDDDWSCAVLQDESQITHVKTASDTPLYAPCYTRSGLPYVTDNDVAAKYLKLTGGTMTGDAAISWGINDRTDWDTYASGIRVMSSVTADSGAPVQYATGISVMARYSFQIAAKGGNADNFFMRAGTRDWKELLHTGNFIDGVNYISPKTTLKGYGIEDWIVEYTDASPDTFQTAGIYRVSTTGVTGKGYNFPYGQVLVLRGSTSSDTIAQIAVPYHNSNLYFRSGTLSNFTDAAHPWWTIFNSGNCNLPTVPWTCSSLTANSVTAKRGEFGYIEFSNIDSSANNGGYIDFHYNGNTADYTSRIIEDAAGQLTLSAGIVNIGTAAKGFLYLQRPSSNYIWANKAGGEICIGTADGGETSALNSGITIIGKRVYIGGTNSGSNALNVKGAIHATTGLYTDGYISAKQSSTSSDRRLKKDFCKIDNALKYVLKTHYIRFRWKDDNKESIGIIAQEEQNREYGFLVQNNEKIGHLTYDYAASTALLGAAIQEEDSKVEKLKKRVAELEKELSNLKRKCQH